MNLGPTTGVRADATKTLPTTLGQTTVTFDGAAAPFYYVSDGFLVAQVALNLAPRSTSLVHLSSAAGTSVPVVLPVASIGAVLVHSLCLTVAARLICEDAGLY